MEFNSERSGALLAARSLRVGYSGRIPAVGGFVHGFVAVPFHVVRREASRPCFKGEAKTWVVDVGGDNATAFWLSNELPR